MLVGRYLGEVWSDHSQNLINLLRARCLKQLLTQIIRELIHHEDSEVISQRGQKVGSERAIVFFLETPLKTATALVLLREL